MAMAGHPAVIVRDNNESLSPVRFIDRGVMRPVSQEYIVHISAKIAPITKCPNAAAELMSRIKANYSAAFSREIEYVEDKIRHLRNRIFLATTSKPAGSRKKRMFSSVGDFMRSSFGVLNSGDKAEIGAQVYILRKQHLEEIHQLEDVKNNSAWIFSKIAETINNVNEISRTIEEKMNENQWGTHRYAILNNIKEAVADCGGAVDALLDVLQHREIRGKIITLEQVEVLLDKIRDDISDDQEIAFSSAFEAITKEKINIQIENDVLRMIFVVPTVVKAESGRFTKQNSSHLINNLVMMMQVRSKFLVKRGKTHLMEISSLVKCIINYKDEKICKVSGALIDEKSDSCLTRLFRNHIIDQQMCKNNLVKAKLKGFLAVRIDESKIMVFTNETVNAKFTCGNETNELIDMYDQYEQRSDGIGCMFDRNRIIDLLHDRNSPSGRPSDPAARHRSGDV